MRSAVFCALALFASSASAQSVLDDSANAISRPELEGLYAKMLFTLPDPIASQLVLLHWPPEKGGSRRFDVICGYMNNRNEQGGFVGFRPFSYDHATKQLVIGSMTSDGQPVSSPELKAAGCFGE